MCVTAFLVDSVNEVTVTLYFLVTYIVFLGSNSYDNAFIHVLV